MTKTAAIFDTLLFSQAMREAGMNEKTANTLAEELKKFREESGVATKGDIELLRKDIEITKKDVIIKISGLVVFTALAICGFIAWFAQFVLAKLL